MAPKVLFHVQHLLGIGHVVRAARIGRALVAAGFDVCVSSGGKSVDGIDWGGARIAQLPEVEAAPGGFSHLVAGDGAPVDDDFKAMRREALLSLLAEFRPDILLIEAYPFARRIMRFELKPLLERARALRPSPIVVSSIRDILQEGRKPERVRETTELIETCFDAVLVHGDREFAPLTMSYPDADRISGMLHYTGIVGPGAIAPSSETFDVVVSAGGGAVGSALFDAALEARAVCELKDARWLLLSGPNLSEARFAALQARAPRNVRVERFRADVPSLLKSAKLSISQAGYNTMADVLSAGCRSVVVPFARDGESEQTRRATLLEDRGLTTLLPESDLTGPALANAIDLSLGRTPPSTSLSMDGATRTAELLKSFLSGD